jgi:hypothetical protein
MRISFYLFAVVMLGCWSLSAQAVAPAPSQQAGAPPSKSPTEAPAQTQGAPPPAGFSQGSAAVFDKAPPGVEEALRARLALFYQCQMDSTFRKAEQYVAEDSKDIYYNAGHSKYFSYKIVQIDFSGDYSSAKVLIVAEVDLHFQGHVVRAPMPFVANWKLENGLWSWYVPIPKPGEVQHTMFGDMITPDPKDAPAEKPGDRTPIGKSFVSTEEALARFGQGPSLSKAVALLAPASKYQDEIYFGNTTKVPMKFHINKDLPPQIIVEPMSGELKPNEGVILKIAYKGADKGTPAPMYQQCYILYGDQDLKMSFYVKLDAQ